MVLPNAEALLFGSLFAVGVMVLAGMERTEPKKPRWSGVLDLKAKSELTVHAFCKNFIPWILSCQIRWK